MVAKKGVQRVQEQLGDMVARSDIEYPDRKCRGSPAMCTFVFYPKHMHNYSIKGRTPHLMMADRRHVSSARAHRIRTTVARGLWPGRRNLSFTSATGESRFCWSLLTILPSSSCEKRALELHLIPSAVPPLCLILSPNFSAFKYGPFPVQHHQ